MKPITLEQQIAVVTKIHNVNELLTAGYPATKRIVSYKLDRAGISVYVMDEDQKVDKYLSVDPVEWGSTVEDDLAAIHAEMDRIINECNEKRMDRFAGAVA